MRTSHIPIFLLLFLMSIPSTGQSAGREPPETLDTRYPVPIGGSSQYPDNWSYPVPTSPRSTENGLPSSLGAVSQSPWFALLSGLASILGLLIPLYATQVRTIPFSLYRSLTWRRVLLIAGGVGVTVFSAIRLLDIDPALRRVFNMLHIVFSKGEASPTHSSGYLETSFWVLCVVFGLALLRLGIRFDPIAQARDIIIREHKSLEDARESHVNRILERSRRGREMSALDHQHLRDIQDFYRHTEWRYVDVVLGAPPPTFPLFPKSHLASGPGEEA